jgi:hypothetical protein
MKRSQNFVIASRCFYAPSLKILRSAGHRMIRRSAAMGFARQTFVGVFAGFVQTFIEVGPIR